MQVHALTLLLNVLSHVPTVWTLCTEGITLEHINTFLWDSIQDQIPTCAYKHTSAVNVHTQGTGYFRGKFYHASAHEGKVFHMICFCIQSWLLHRLIQQHSLILVLNTHTGFLRISKYTKIPVMLDLTFLFSLKLS